MYKPWPSQLRWVVRHFQSTEGVPGLGGDRPTFRLGFGSRNVLFSTVVTGCHCTILYRWLILTKLSHYMSLLLMIPILLYFTHVYSVEIELSELLRDFEASPPLLSVHRFQATDGLTDEVWESRRIAEKTSAKWDLDGSGKFYVPCEGRIRT